MYSGIINGRVLDGELLYTKILEVLHLPTDCFIEISLQSTGHITWVLIPFPWVWFGFGFMLFNDTWSQ